MPTTIRNYGCLVTLAAVVQLTGCRIESSCTALGCQNAVTATFTLSVTPAELDGATVKACRNTECSEAKIKYTSKQTYPDAGGCPDTGTSGVQCAALGAPPELNCEMKGGSYLTCMGDAAATGSTLSVMSPIINGTPADGETLTMSVTTASGTVLETKTGTSKYEDQYPNGKACGAVCKTTKL